jgi:hypothetical protein
MVTHCAFPREWLSAFLVLNKHQFNTNLTVFHHERLLNINLLPAPRQDSLSIIIQIQSTSLVCRPCHGHPPDRPDDEKLLTRYLNPFSRGPRQCLGMYLAWVEIYSYSASLFRMCRIELFSRAPQNTPSKRMLIS